MIDPQVKPPTYLKLLGIVALQGNHLRLHDFA